MCEQSFEVYDKRVKYFERIFIKSELASMVVDLEQQLSAANAQISTLSTENKSLSEKLQNVEVAKEKAEAQCAAMRFWFEKYVRESCKVIRQAVADGLGYPDDVDGKCGGYAGKFGDEPCDSCKECIAMAYNEEANEEIADAGTALLARMRHMEDALRMVQSNLGGHYQQLSKCPVCNENEVNALGYVCEKCLSKAVNEALQGET